MVWLGICPLLVPVAAVSSSFSSSLDVDEPRLLGMEILNLTWMNGVEPDLFGRPLRLKTLSIAPLRPLQPNESQDGILPRLVRADTRDGAPEKETEM